MKYIEFVRPNGQRVAKEIGLPGHFERLAQACLDHEDGIQFTYEDCGTVVNLCFEGFVKLSGEPHPYAENIASEIFPHGDSVEQGWRRLILASARCLDIHIPEVLHEQTLREGKVTISRDGGALALELHNGEEGVEAHVEPQDLDALRLAIEELQRKGDLL